MLPLTESLRQDPYKSRDYEAVLHHAARKVRVCNIVNDECKKCDKSRFWEIWVVTSLTEFTVFYVIALAKC